MTHSESWPARRTRWMNRFHARRASLARPAAGFQSQPEPRTIGTYARGKQLIAGNLLFAGHLAVSDGPSIWQVESPGAAFDEEIHGFTWLDDLAAVGDGPARQKAREWTHEWIDLYAAGRGPGWTPDLTGRRLIRWINNALFLLSGAETETSAAFYRSLAQQTIFLSRRWQSASRGLPRFEALTGLIYAGLSLTGMDAHVAPAMKALARDCIDQIDIEGGIPTRNPEELLEVFTLLNWAAAALSEAGMMPARDHLAAIERIAPTLRALRHSDGGLARFHGGGRGQEGRLDQALASSGVKTMPGAGLAMGYARLSAGRTSLILDAAPPPQREASYNGHASTLAFELTSGRRPLIVNCGSGVSFGEDWRRAGRATPSHSTLGIEGFSSSRLGALRMIGGHPRELLAHTPREVRIEARKSEDGTGLVAGHDGYVLTHGLTHIRHVDLSNDGRGIAGEDTLAAIDTSEERRFDRMRDASGLSGLAFDVRFHLHPDVDATLDMGGTAISMALKSGEIWIFRHDGVGEMKLLPSVYLEKGRLKPRASKQVVLSGRAIDYATRVRWTLAKAQDTPTTIRDLERDESETLE